MALTSLNPNLLGTDSSGASKLSSAGGLVQLHSTGVFTIANTSANNISIANTGAVTISQGLTSNTLTVSTNTATIGTTLYGVANGNIGVGTSSPSQKFQVNGAALIGNGGVDEYLYFDSTAAYVGRNASTGDIWLNNGGSQNTILGVGGTEKFRIDANGQPYQNQSYLFGTSYNCYFGNSTTSMNPTSAGWTDTGLSFSNVYIPTNTRKVLLWVQCALRNNGLNTNHTALRCRVVNNSTSATTYVGDGSWGFGINMVIDSGKNHYNLIYNVNLLNFGGNGNQASLSAGSTYTIYMQVYDAYASGGNLRLAGEAGGTYVSYTPHHGTIWVI